MTLLVRRKGNGRDWEVTNSSQKRILRIEVQVEIQSGEGFWECLQKEFGLRTEGNTPDEAMKKMKEALLRGDALKAEPEFAEKFDEPEVEAPVVEDKKSPKKKGVLQSAIASVSK